MDWPRIRRRLLWVAPMIIAACGRAGPDQSPRSAPPSGEPRLVSLSPAISRTLVDLGLDGFLVGRSAYCTGIDDDLPVCGDLLRVDFERLTRVQPTHLLLQPAATGVDPALVELASEQGWVLGQWRLDGLEDIEGLVLDLPGVVFTSDDPRQAIAASRAAELSNNLALALSPGARPTWRGRTLIISGVDPVLAFGRETYLHDVLVAIGGENVVEGRGWITLSQEDVVRLDPAAIILVTTGSGSDADVAAALAPMRSMDIDAARAERLGVLAHPDALLPSSAVTEVAARLRRILGEFAESSS
jgi:ABC-type Fe3+-hydroxamate transport system substrate-binding protein